MCIYHNALDRSCLDDALYSLSILNRNETNHLVNRLWLNTIIGDNRMAADTPPMTTLNTQNRMNLVRFLRLGQHYQASSLWKNAEIAYQNAMYLFPERPDPYLKLGSLYLSQDRYHDAFTILDKGITASEEKAQLLLQKGFAYLRAGNFQEALEQFRNCKEWNDMFGGLLYSEPSQLHYFTGEALLRLGQLDQAIREYTIAIQLDQGLEWAWPTYAAYVGLGDVYLRQNDFAQALDAYNQANAIALEGDQKRVVQKRLQQLNILQAAPNLFNF